MIYVKITIIWWWCIKGVNGGRGLHQQPRMGRVRLLWELGMGEGQCSILRIMQVLWRVAFTQEKGPRGFIYLCCCFVGKKTPNPTNNNHQGVRDVKLRNLSVLTGFSRYTLMLLCSQHVAANVPQITWTNQEFCFRLYWFVMFLLLYGIWGLFPVDEGEISLIYLAAHEVHSQYSGL